MKHPKSTQKQLLKMGINLDFIADELLDLAEHTMKRSYSSFTEDQLYKLQDADGCFLDFSEEFS